MATIPFVLRLLMAAFSFVSVGILVAADNPWFEIQVIDRDTRRGVPMVELITVHDVMYVTDSAGRVAVYAEEFAGKQVFFSVRSAGYRFPADNFGISGVRLQIEPGRSEVIEIERINPAERLYRITGQDLYLDSVRLKQPIPLVNPTESGMVCGQDSVQVARYRDRLYWFWGDTNRLSYPLGLFRTAGATSPLPEESRLDISDGIELNYFTNSEGFVRAMVDVPNREGVVWIDGVCTVFDDDGRERMVAHFSRRPGLEKQLEHGLLIYNDEREIFEVLQVLDLDDTWRFIRDHPVKLTENGIEYLAFGNPFPVTRVPATLKAIQDRSAYQSFTCTEAISKGDGDSAAAAAALTRQRSEEHGKPRLDDSGKVHWNWSAQPPTTQKQEHHWLKSGVLMPEQTRYVPQSHELGGSGDAASYPVLLHSGAVFFNAFRDRWVMIAVESASTRDSPSYLGEVWYSEAESVTGPFRRAVRIATHPGQTFYNPCHHPFFDQQAGRVIYFEGTYCNTFTRSPATPRYNYNQLMYRLDLGQLAPAF